jgi:DNA uptake protein ComE-like DNA-binding protein
LADTFFLAWQYLCVCKIRGAETSVFPTDFQNTSYKQQAHAAYFETLRSRRRTGAGQKAWQININAATTSSLHEQLVNREGAKSAKKILLKPSSRPLRLRG